MKIQLPAKNLPAPTPRRRKHAKNKIFLPTNYTSINQAWVIF